MLQPKRIVKEGFATGLIGAGAVAFWFFIVDLIAGRPFFTPAMLGSAVFFGVRDAAMVEITYPTVITYTMLHLLAFLVVGAIAAALVAEAEEVPSILFVLVVLFVIFEFGFYIIVAVVFTQLLKELAWINVAVGNLIAAGGMGYYLWRAHPKLRQALHDQPLGATGDHEIPRELSQR